MHNVEIRDGALYFHGKPYFPFGGEVQYFRLRDKGYERNKTWKIWRETLDAMAEEGMNLVTTYVPWDYHETAPGKFDFSGAKDLDKFLEMCAERKMLVQIKPGPYITAEWPNGPGWFGAVPAWLKEKHPETLVLNRKGRPFKFHSLGRKGSEQCSFLHPVFLEYVRKWYEAVAPVLLKYIHEIPCIFSVQVDNETNFFWTDKYKIDYNPAALEHYRNFLKERYNDIRALNEAYGGEYPDFDSILPPPKPPRRQPYANRAHVDWFEAGWSYITEYLSRLRRMWENLGIREPDILFTTNDTHAQLPMANMKLALPNIKAKIGAGLPTLDTYPKNNPLSRALDERPSDAAFNTRLLDYYGDYYPGKNGSWVMGAEMQGGMFRAVGITPRVRPEETRRLVTKALAAGMKAYSTFVIREGYNLDNSVYHYQAPINYKGKKNARFDVLAKAAGFLSEFGNKFHKSRRPECEIVLLVNPDYRVPLGGTRLAPMKLWDTGYGGIWGWLERAGFSVDVADIKKTTNLDGYKVAIYPDAGLSQPEDIEKLAAYTEAGGMLVHIGWPSDADLSGDSARRFERLLKYMPRRFLGAYRLAVRLSLPDGEERRFFMGVPPMFVWEVPEKADVFLKAGAGGALAMEVSADSGKIVQISLNPGSYYNTRKLYKLHEGELQALNSLAKNVMERAAIEPSIRCLPYKVEASLRLIGDGGDALVFLTNDGPATTANVIPGTGWKIAKNEDYTVRSLWPDGQMGVRSGKDIINEGISIELDKWESEILLIEVR